MKRDQEEQEGEQTESEISDNSARGMEEVLTISTSLLGCLVHSCNR